ncbi:hypothetical protein B0H13DRAFT_2339022 [Mycena leptocephala]|nr:hypothetical protein B0H13DRAFT_2339022 [Mycena leptocephala]
MLCVRTHPHVGDPKNYVQMIEVHPDGTQDVLLIARAPDTQSDNTFYGPVIRGELAAAASNWVGDRYIIINCKKQSYFILQCHNLSPSLIDLIPRHFILKTRSGDGEDQIHVISDDALRAWAPVTGINDSEEFLMVSVDDISKLSTFVDTENTNGGQSSDHMSVVDCPLRDGDYLVWIHRSMFSQIRGSYTGVLLCYRLSVPTRGEVKWCRRRRASEIRLGILNGAIPYSGHTVYRLVHLSGPLPPKCNIFTPISAAPHVEVSLPHTAYYVDVARYSGALMSCTKSMIADNIKVCAHASMLGITPPTKSPVHAYKIFYF